MCFAEFLNTHPCFLPVYLFRSLMTLLLLSLWELKSFAVMKYIGITKEARGNGRAQHSICGMTFTFQKEADEINYRTFTTSDILVSLVSTTSSVTLSHSWVSVCQLVRISFHNPTLITKTYSEMSVDIGLKELLDIFGNMYVFFLTDEKIHSKLNSTYVQ